MAKTLLLADDSPTIHRVVELSFAHEDVRIVAVSDGERAMEWLGSDTPDVVVVDVAVPEVDGYAIATHVKKTKRLSQVPVLLMSGAFEAVDEEKARQIGCDGVLVKPFEPRHLVERVLELVSQAQNGAGRVADAPGTGAAPGATGPKPVESTTRGPSVDELMREAAARKAAAADGEADLPDEEPVALELPSRRPWDKGTPRAAGSAQAAPQAPGAPPAQAPPKQKRSLVNAFSALLAAEKSTPEPAARSSASASASLADDVVDEAVRRALTRLTRDEVRRIVLETAERLIREEIEKIKADPE